MEKIRNAQSIAELWNLIPITNCIGKCGARFCSQWIASRQEIENLPKIKPEGMLCPYVGYNQTTGESVCTVWQSRLTVCRLWGSDSNRCKFGCKPDRRLTKQEADAILNKSYELGGGLDSPWLSKDTCVVCKQHVPPMGIIHNECARYVIPLTELEFNAKFKTDNVKTK